MPRVSDFIFTKPLPLPASGWGCGSVGADTKIQRYIQDARWQQASEGHILVEVITITLKMCSTLHHEQTLCVSIKMSVKLHTKHTNTYPPIMSSFIFVKTVLSRIFHLPKRRKNSSQSFYQCLQ